MSTESPPAKPVRRSPLPELARHPAILLAAIAVPQAVLLFVNLRAWHLISGEVDDDQRQMAMALFLGELVLFLGGSIFGAWQWKARKRVAWGWNWAIFLPHVAYLAFFTIKIHEIVPDALSVWIVRPESLIYLQFVLVMPAVFCSALALACFPTRLSGFKDIGFSVLVAAGIPGFWYLVISTGFGDSIHNVPGAVIAILVIGSSLICLTGLLRILTTVFTWASTKGWIGQMILVFLVALAMPVGGLLLNARFPFPADFQAWQCYALTLANGLVLLIPATNRPRLDRPVWLLQCAFFSFTLYFFFVFLPFLPLSAIAIVVAGLGFLMLAPTALFVVHLRRIGQGLKRGQPLWLGAIVACAMPLYVAGEAGVDRLVLHQAIDYVFPRTLGRTDFGVTEPLSNEA